MPGFIRTKGDEEKWSKAKVAANKSHSESEGDSYWAIVNSIYQKMNKVDLMQNLVEKLNKAGGDEDEEGYNVQDYGENQETPEDLESMGLHETDPFEEDSDEADAWFREHAAKNEEEQGQEPSAAAATSPETEVENSKEAEVRPPSKSGYSDWSPREDYSNEEQNAIKEHMNQGYSHREAERMAGAHRGPKNFQEALTHPVRPSPMSEKMLGELKGIAGPWLERSDRQSKMSADPEKNPMKFASGKMMQAHEDATKDYNKAHNEFLESDQVKGLKGLDRHKAVQAWKQDWKSKNPEYNQGMSNVSSAQKHFKEAKDVYGKNIHDKLMHIATGGLGTDPSSQMTAEEAAQHVGASKEDEGGHQASIIKDPSASFAAANQPFMEHARAQTQSTRGPKTRMQAVQEQMQEKPKAPPIDPAVAHKVIIRRANPDQMERFKRTTSARNTLGVNKPEGDK